MAVKPDTATTKPTQEIAKVKTGALAQMPAFLKGTAGQGIEGIAASDIETPRLLLLQPTSPQVTDFEDARPGMFWHNMLNCPVGDHKTGFEGVIAFVDKRAILWRPRPPVDVGGILARSDDMKVWSPANASFDVKLKTGKIVNYNTGSSVVSSGLLAWGTSDPEDPNSLPAGTEMVNCVMFFPEYPDMVPAVFSFQRSSTKVSKKLMGRLSVAPCASYGMRFHFGSELVDAGGNKFYIPTFDSIGYVEDEDEMRRYESLYKSLKRSGLKMREESDEDIQRPVREDADAPSY